MAGKFEAIKEELTHIFNIAGLVFAEMHTSAESGANVLTVSNTFRRMFKQQVEFLGWNPPQGLFEDAGDGRFRVSHVQRFFEVIGPAIRKRWLSAHKLGLPQKLLPEGIQDGSWDAMLTSFTVTDKKPAGDSKIVWAGLLEMMEEANRVSKALPFHIDEDDRNLRAAAKGKTAATDKMSLSKEARAIAALMDHPEWTDKRIAEAAGCSRQSLYEMPHFVMAKEILKKGKKGVPKGTKDRHGNVEAWREDDESEE